MKMLILNVKYYGKKLMFLFFKQNYLNFIEHKLKNQLINIMINLEPKIT